MVGELRNAAANLRRRRPVLIAIALVAFQFKRAKKMVSQYPWLYEPVGPFGWRKIGE